MDSRFRGNDERGGGNNGHPKVSIMGEEEIRRMNYVATIDGTLPPDHTGSGGAD